MTGENTVTEKLANQAREQYAEQLRKAGAHSVTVDEVKLNNKNSFAVIAFVDDKSIKLPQQLAVKTGKKTVQVPLIIREYPRFQLE